MISPHGWAKPAFSCQKCRRSEAVETFPGPTSLEGLVAPSAASREKATKRDCRADSWWSVNLEMRGSNIPQYRAKGPGFFSPGQRPGIGPSPHSLLRPEGPRYRLGGIRNDG